MNFEIAFCATTPGKGHNLEIEEFNRKQGHWLIQDDEGTPSVQNYLNKDKFSYDESKMFVEIASIFQMLSILVFCCKPLTILILRLKAFLDHDPDLKWKSADLAFENYLLFRRKKYFQRSVKFKTPTEDLAKLIWRKSSFANLLQRFFLWYWRKLKIQNRSES